MFNDKEILSLKLFVQDITMHLLPFEQQEHIIAEDGHWCCDWWSIEIIKCLIYGKDAYLLDPVPNRLKNNANFAHRHTLYAHDFKTSMLQEIIKNQDFSDVLYVCEVGRGIDILIASMVKPWKKIVCYDNNPYMLEQVNRYFRDKLGLPIETIYINSGVIDFKSFNEPMILVANSTRISRPQKEDMMNNKNLVSIINGSLLDKNNPDLELVLEGKLLHDYP